MPGDWVEIGAVRTVNPNRRELRVGAARPVTAAMLDWVGVRDADGAMRRLRVATARADRDGLIVALAAGVPRDGLPALRGETLWAPAEALPASAETGWRARDLEGLTALGPDGRALGRVTAVHEAGGTGSFVVSPEDGPRIALPAIAAVVRELDWAAGTVRLGDIEAYKVEHAD